MLEGCHLTSVRDGRTLFKELNLQLEAGRVLQVEGVNGAGKTTLLRILCGLTQPREGSVYWKGDDIRQCRTVYYEDLLYIGHHPGIKLELTALENLRFFHSLGGHDGAATALEQALEQVGLYGYEESPVRTLSAGQRRRVALARLWLSMAPLWVLDEPFTAIDRNGIRNLEIRLLHHIQAGGLVIMTSHQAVRLDGCPVQQLLLG
jgi:heme exporter protein A